MAKAPSTKVIARKASPNKAVPTRSAPVTRVSVSDGKGGERSVSVRKIENGYIVSETSYGGRGGYKCVERFTEKAPVIDVAGVKAKRK